MVRARSISETGLSSETWEIYTSWVAGPGFGIYKEPECGITNLQSMFYVPGSLLSILHTLNHLSLQQLYKVWINGHFHFMEEDIKAKR